MKLHDGMLVKRKDNGAKGVVQKLQGNMVRVKYHDGTFSYTNTDSIKTIFVVPELNIDVRVGCKPKEDGMTYDEYLNQSEDVVTKHLEKKAHKIASDLIDQQDHYTNNGIQPIEIMKANMTKEEFRGFLEGNILKYPLRYKHKNGLEDLKKAKTYLTWLIEDIEERGL